MGGGGWEAVVGGDIHSRRASSATYSMQIGACARTCVCVCVCVCVYTHHQGRNTNNPIF